MTPEELIVKTANTFKQIAAGVSVNHIVSVTPVASTVAEMVVRAHWNPEDFTFRSEGSSVLFKAGCAGEVNLSGYNFAYQVKLCADAIAEAGYFD